MQLIQQGAEAKLFKSDYLGKEVLLKKRITKSYRIKELDEKIRKERTKEEAILLSKAKTFGVRTPLIYKVDLKNHELILEFVKGKLLKNCLSKKNLSLCKIIGEKVALLHSNGIIHGDLTTSNLIVIGKKTVCFIDFGLGFASKELEDKAVDLMNFKKTFLATHFNLPQGWELFLQGYKKSREWKAVFERMKKIDKRIRYA